LQMRHALLKPQQQKQRWQLQQRRRHCEIAAAVVVIDTSSSSARILHRLVDVRALPSGCSMCRYQRQKALKQQ
jgi:hypothetical protein